MVPSRWSATKSASFALSTPRLSITTSRMLVARCSASCAGNRTSPLSNQLRILATGGSQVRRCRLPLRGTPTEDGQSLEHEDVDKNDAVPVALESRREINGTLVLRIVGVEQSNDDVGVENDLSHRRVRQCRLLRRPARHQPRRLQHGSCATMQRHEVFADALPARRQPPLRGVRSRRDSQGRALDRRALRVRVERPRRKDGPISASENQLRAPQDSNL